MENSTIAAIATPLATGGVGVIRISGPRSLAILSHVFQPVYRTPPNGPRPTNATRTLRSHRFYHGYIVDEKQLVDEVLVVFMRAPRSYTGEDVVEVHAHGSPFVLNTILQLLVKGGARVADPGEFTRRAFLNNKIDLTQAEAVADIIEARSKKALDMAVHQMAGTMNREVEAIKEHLCRTLAEIEASIDFSDQTDEPVSPAAIQNRLQVTVVERLKKLVDRHKDFSWVRTGVRVALVGAPNVGKSTLLNTLLGRERAIVSATPGTTRDFIEESLLVDGLCFVFTDTAGLSSETGDPLEKKGMERTKAVISEADTVIYMIDASAGLSTEDFEIMSSLRPRNMILVGNKTDLCQTDVFAFPSPWRERFPVARLSALTGDGVEKLKALLVGQRKDRLEMTEENDPLPNLRHKASLEKALSAVMSALDAINRSLPEDLVAIDLREASNALKEITGCGSGTDVLDAVFSRFCIGK